MSITYILIIQWVFIGSVLNPKVWLSFCCLRGYYSHRSYLLKENMLFIESDNLNNKNFRIFQISNKDIIQYFFNDLDWSIREEFARIETVRISIAYLGVLFLLYHLKCQLNCFTWQKIKRPILFTKWSLLAILYCFFYVRVYSEIVFRT